jgi:subtilisin family serine protease
MSKKIKPETRKLQPKLRMIANCDSVVNALRAEHTGAVMVEESVIQAAHLDRPMRGDTATCERKCPPTFKRKKLDKKGQEDVLINVFIEMTDAAEERARRVASRRGFKVKARKGNLAMATIPLSELDTIIDDEDVSYVELGEGLSTPTPTVAPGRPDMPRERRIDALENRHKDGRGKVLIGIIDVQGFDFAHPEFLDDDGRTRFVRIWDQGGDARPSPKERGGRGMERFDYGSEFRHKDLNEALKDAPTVKLPPTDIEPQSQMTPGSHGTHVASIAAGKHGVCPGAAIAGVLISLTADDSDRRRSFYDSTRIVDAVEYLIEVARELGEENQEDPWPVSINISLGTNGHAHDASAACSRWIDSALSVPGRSVCVAAGNAGQDISEFEGDIGYVMGRIHTSGQLKGAGLTKDIQIVVVGNGKADLSENELEIWYEPQDRFAVEIRPPADARFPDREWIGPIEPCQFVENAQLPDGSFLSVYNELYHPANGHNYIAIYLTPLLSPEGIVGVPAGVWTVRLRAREVRDGRYHGWIERDDPRRLGRMGDREAWRFPSYFAKGSYVDDSTVGSLACGRYVVSVANLDDPAEKIHKTSSQGPTRDRRCKPDVSAPGTDIVAAKGFAGPDDLWVKMTGTSMAGPYVAGVIGLMFAVEPKLTAAQVNGILQRNARPLPGGRFAWVNTAGYGRIDPAACLNDAATANQHEDVTR